MYERHPLLTYTALRVVLFAVPFGLLWAFGMDFVWALLIAAIASSIASIFLLTKSRDALSVSIATRAARTKARMEERTRSEDEWDEAQRTQNQRGTDGSVDQNGV